MRLVSSLKVKSKTRASRNGEQRKEPGTGIQRKIEKENSCSFFVGEKA